jgi:hypothetical protein
VWNATRLLLDRAVAAADSDTIALALSPLLSVPINTPTPISIEADLQDSASLGVVRLRLASPASFSARNASTGAVVPAVFATQPIEGPPITVQSCADTLRVRAVPGVPASAPVGATDVDAMQLVLRHPGDPAAASVRCDVLTLRVRDQLNLPIVPSTLFERVQIFVAGALAGAVANLPSSPGQFAVALAGVTLAAGQQTDLVVRCDIEASAPAGLFELSLIADGLQGVDANLGTPVWVAPDSGAEFPLASGFIELEAPARELTAGFDDAMPALLATGAAATEVATVSFRNRAAIGVIRVDHLDLIAADRGFGARPLGDVAARIEGWVADTLWGASDLAVGSLTGTLASATPLEMDARAPVDVSLRIVPRSDAPGGFRLGLRREGIGVVQPPSPLLFVSVTPEEGQSFPFYTEVGSLSAASLAASYSNFPNPFAPARQSTSFAFYLPRPARVSLTIWTALGDKVITIVSRASRGAGIQASDRWDGKNGEGHLVMNGVYLAELIAEYDDGGRERLLRKVAVAR